jgi:four helix bundle protein
MAKKVDDLLVYQKVLQFAAAINAILERPAVRKDWKTRGQMVDAADSMAANIEEGFQQGTDKAFAHYLTIAKGSAAELIGHFRRAATKKHVTEAELAPIVEQLEEIGRMLGGLIKYLYRCDYKDRGRFKSATESPKSTKQAGLKK